MTDTMYCGIDTREVEAGRRCVLTELVRGDEGRLVEQITPLVTRQSGSLDLECVERIDAAGISALILLYRIAHESGHEFTVSNVSPRVAELLALVGLDQVLLSQNMNQSSHFDQKLTQTAA